MLKEKTVQKRALNYLENYYNNRWIRRKIYKAEEVRTKKMFGGKRADGLLAYQNWWFGKPYVVSMEAKSIKTLPAIQPRQDWRRWLRNSLRFGGLLCLASGLLFAYAQGQHGMHWMIPVGFCLGTGLIFGLVTNKHCRHQTIDVINQLKQYPANEQWLAFSKDGYQALATEKQKVLQRVCKYRGIGLLIIGKKETVEVLAKPKRKWSWFWETRGGWQWINDYLVYYSREKEIRSVI